MIGTEEAVRVYLIRFIADLPLRLVCVIVNIIWGIYFQKMANFKDQKCLSWEISNLFR